MSRVAHSIADGQTRSRDVFNDDNVNVDFASLLLTPAIQAGLESAGFERPSPIQLKAIPLGRCGLDLIVQAKSGTGKTCVFSVIALESLDLESISTQVLVLAPTREIAVQIQEVIHSIGSAMTGLRCHVFIGGTMIGPDRQKLKKCHIAVGTPGRIKQLIEFELLKTESLRLFVLDEADKLLDHKFKEQVNWIYHKLTENKQMLALSATYPEYLAQQLTQYMRDPVFVRLNRKDLALHGIKQYYKIVPGHRLANKAFEVKVEHLLDILSHVVFTQCLVFSNLQTRAQNLSDMLNFKGWPSTYISGHQEQTHRLKAMDMLKKFQCRILISTDLTARGIDAENVNLIINLDVPNDVKTYFHRIGRAGRFGTQGAAITLVSAGQEEVLLTSIKKQCHGKMNPLPETLPSDLVTTNLPPQDLGYTGSSDSDDDNLEESGQLEFYHDQQLVGSGSKSKSSRGNQVDSDHSQERTAKLVSRTCQVTNITTNGVDINTVHQKRRSQKVTRKPGIDVACQVKPNPLKGIIRIDNLDFKIPSLSMYRVQRTTHWTYEKAKSDFEIFLDPSKASSPDTLLQQSMEGDQSSLINDECTQDQEGTSVRKQPYIEQLMPADFKEPENEGPVQETPQSNLEFSVQTICNNSNHKDILSMNEQSNRAADEVPSEDPQQHAACPIELKGTIVSQKLVPDVKTDLPNAAASSILNSHAATLPVHDSHAQSNTILNVRNNDDCSALLGNDHCKDKAKPVKQIPPKTENRRFHPKSLSVGHMLQQIAPQLPEDDKPHTGNSLCRGKDPVWEMYKQLLPKSSEQTVTITSTRSKCLRDTGSNESDDSQDSSRSGTESESSSQSDSDNDDEEADSSDESSESESESESLEETETSLEGKTAGQTNGVKSTDKTYEDQMSRDMENLAFDQYGNMYDQSWYHGNMYDQNWYDYGESNQMTVSHSYTDSYSHYYNAPYYSGYYYQWPRQQDWYNY